MAIKNIIPVKIKSSFSIVLKIFSLLFVLALPIRLRIIPTGRNISAKNPPIPPPPNQTIGMRKLATKPMIEKIIAQVISPVGFSSGIISIAQAALFSVPFTRHLIFPFASDEVVAVNVHVLPLLPIFKVPIPSLLSSQMSSP